jgi:hypothetical protein
MCALVFYFASRNHLKFKFDMNSNEFANYRGFGKLEKVFSFSTWPWAEIQLSLETDPSSS